MEDPDADGLTDAIEVRASETDPLVADSDSAGTAANESGNGRVLIVRVYIREDGEFVISTAFGKATIQDAIDYLQNEWNAPVNRIY